MLLPKTVFVCFLLPYVYSNFPIKNCKSSEIDVLLHAPSIDTLQKARLKSLVKLFLSKSEHEPKIRVAVFITDYTTEPLVGFKDYNSSQELLHQIDTLGDHKQERLQVVESIQMVSVKYLEENEIYSGNRNQVVIILCEYCIQGDDDEDDNGDDFTSTSKNNILNTYNIKITKYGKIPIHFQKHGTTAFISATDDMKKNQFISMTLCGECNPGWIATKSETISSLHSCYKLEVLDRLISHKEASDRCLAIDAHLVSVATNVELNHILEACLAYTNVDRLLVYTGVCHRPPNRKHWSRWITGSPFIFGFSELNYFQDDLCPSIEINFTQSNVTYSMSQAYSNIKITNQIFCEFDLNHLMADGRNYTDVFDEASCNEEVKRIADNISVANIKLFDCGESLEQVPYSLVRDGYQDCKNRKDEFLEYREEKNCFLCSVNFKNVHYVERDYNCISVQKKCDGIADCPGNEDEENCNSCMETSFKDGTCLPSQWFYNNDRYFFTYSRHQEAINVTKIMLVEKMLALNLEDESVEMKMFNKLIIPCKELIERDYEYSTAGKEKIKNYKSRVWSTRCVHLKGMYTKQQIGCSDLSHLENCEHFICGDGLFKCKWSFCVPYYMVNDGTINCPHGDDETVESYNRIFSVHLFPCRESSVLVHPSHVCDGIDHCPTGDDERHCFEKCPSGFTCAFGVTAVSDPSKINYINLLDDIDNRTRVLGLSGINLSRVVLGEVLALELIELYLSNCSINNELINAVMSSFRTGLHKVMTLDLSYNDINVRHLEHIHVNIYTGRIGILNLSHTDLTSFELVPDIKRPLTIDFSFTQLKTFTIISNLYKIAIEYLNFSNTKLSNLNWSEKHLIINTLDLRNTKLDFHYNDAFALRNVEILSVIYGDSFKLCCGTFSGEGISSHKCFAPSDPVSSCHGLIGDDLKRSLLLIVGITGVVGNTILLSLKIYNNQNINTQGCVFYTTNLNLSNLILNVYLILISGADVYYGNSYVLHDTIWRDSAMCKAAGFIANVAFKSSSLFIIMITFEVYYGLKFQTADRSPSTLRLISSCICVWLICLVIPSIPFMFPKWLIYSSNAMCLGLPFYINHQAGWVFSFIFFTILPCLEMVCVVIGLVMVFKAVFLDLATNTSSLLDEAEMMAAAKTAALVDVPNIVCHFFICISGLISGAGIEISHTMIGWLTVFVFPLTSALNPVIFIWPLILKK